MRADGSLEQPRSGPRGEALRRRLQWLVVGRVLVATLLLGGTLLLTVNTRTAGYSGFTPSALIGLIVAIYAASAVFAATLLSGQRLRANAYAQVGWDLMTTTALVYLSGAASSPFTVLYGIPILAAAMTLGPAASRTIAGLSLLGYLTVAYTVAGGLVPYPPDQAAAAYERSPSELGYSLLSNGVGLVLVALLAGSLAERLSKAGGRLAEAEAEAAALARLNDDIVRSMSTGLLTTDRDDRVRTINPAGAAMFGATAEELLGAPLADLIPAAVDAAGTRDESLARRPTGDEFPVGFTRTPLGDGEGSLLVFQDLTEIRALREQAERAERLAALGRLASALAHEIRNPLGSISGSVQLISELPELGDEDRHLIGIVLKEVDRLNELVSTMLDLSRPSRPRPAEVDIATIAEELASVARADSTLGSVTIDVQRPSAPVPAEVDPNQFRQLLWNLLKNAIQASPIGGVVTVEIRPEGDHVSIVVRDQGAGIPASERERLFDMFYSKRDHGIGLGLALVKQIVDAHQGQIDIGEGPEGGAELRVRLPQAQPSASAPTTVR